MLTNYRVTPEMLLYRFSELVPQHFGIGIHFLRFHDADGDYHLVKQLNMSQLPLPSGIGLNEHYCRRWLTTRLLQEMVDAVPVSAEMVASNGIYAQRDGTLEIENRTSACNCRNILALERASVHGIRSTVGAIAPRQYQCHYRFPCRRRSRLNHPLRR